MSTTKKARTTQEVAERFNHFAKQGKWKEVQEELFADNAISIEPENMPGPQKVTGKQAIIQKGLEFAKTVEARHGGYSGEPVVAGNYFAVPMGMDVTVKERGRNKMDEIAVYEVKDGKIVKEQFFY